MGGPETKKVAKWAREVRVPLLWCDYTKTQRTSAAKGKGRRCEVARTNGGVQKVTAWLVGPETKKVAKWAREVRVPLLWS
jgi:hypothetical protein